MESKIYLYLKIIPIIFIFITTFWISYIQIDKTKIEVENNIKNEIDSIYKKEKEYLDQNIDIILDYIRHQKKQTINIAQNRIKDKVYMNTWVAVDQWFTNARYNIYDRLKNK